MVVSAILALVLAQFEVVVDQEDSNQDLTHTGVEVDDDALMLGNLNKLGSSNPKSCQQCNRASCRLQASVTCFHRCFHIVGTILLMTTSHVIDLDFIVRRVFVNARRNILYIGAGNKIPYRTLNCGPDGIDLLLRSND
jgi:hypothetical protein